MCEVLSLDPNECGVFFKDVVTVSYSNGNGNGVEMLYFQNNVLCDNVFPGLYLLQAAVSLFNPKNIGNYLLIVIDDESVKFARDGKIFKGYALCSQPIRNVRETMERLVLGRGRFRVTLHKKFEKEEVFIARVNSLSDDGVITFKEEFGNVVDVNLYGCSFIRMQVL
jgi:hypothetical protein